MITFSNKNQTCDFQYTGDGITANGNLGFNPKNNPKNLKMANMSFIVNAVNIGSAIIDNYDGNMHCNINGTNIENAKIISNVIEDVIAEIIEEINK